MIVSLLDGAVNQRDLRLRIMEKYGVSRRDFNFHLKDSKYGLMTRKIAGKAVKIIIKEGDNLSLNFSDPAALGEIVGLLINDPQRGDKIEKKLDRVFAICFLDVFGDFASVSFHSNILANIPPKSRVHYPHAIAAIASTLSESAINEEVETVMKIASEARGQLTTEYKLSYVLFAISRFALLEELDGVLDTGSSLFNSFFWPKDVLIGLFNDRDTMNYPEESFLRLVRVVKSILPRTRESRASKSCLWSYYSVSWLDRLNAHKSRKGRIKRDAAIRNFETISEALLLLNILNGSNMETLQKAVKVGPSTGHTSQFNR